MPVADSPIASALEVAIRADGDRLAGGVQFPALSVDVPGRPGVHPDARAAAGIADGPNRRAGRERPAGVVGKLLEVKGNRRAQGAVAEVVAQPVETEHERDHLGAEIVRVFAIRIPHCRAAAAFRGALAGRHDVAWQNAVPDVAELFRLFHRTLPTAILASGGLYPGHGVAPRSAGVTVGRAGFEPARSDPPVDSGYSRARRAFTLSPEPHAPMAPPCSCGLDTQVAARVGVALRCLAVHRDAEAGRPEVLHGVAALVGGKPHDVGEGLRGRADAELRGALRH